MKSIFEIAICSTLAALLMVSCSGSLQSSSKTESGAALNNYKTYAWIVPPDHEGKSREDDRVYAPLIHAEADAALKKKGMILDTLKPDAVFIFNTKVEDRVKYSKAPTGYYSYYYGGPGYYAGYGTPLPGGEVLPEEYAQGMIAFQMFDTNSKKVLWSGWAEQPLSGKSNIDAVIKHAVHDIFAKLPIKHK